MAAALREAARNIEIKPGLPAPRPYPELAKAGHAWAHAGRYWIVFSTTAPPVIEAVFYDEPDIPGRLF